MKEENKVVGMVKRVVEMEKVRRDEEQAARDEQIKRDEVRKRDAEFRLERLRTAKGLAPLVKAKAEEEKEEEGEEEPESKNSDNNGHINLFEGIKIFDPVRGTEKRKELLGEREGWKKEKRMKKEEGKSSGVAAIISVSDPDFLIDASSMSCCTDLWIYSAGYGLWDFVLFVLGLEDAGYAVGARVLELLCHRDKAIDNYLGSLMSWDIIVFHEFRMTEIAIISETTEK
ncbi:hypothetical protein AHAS_Ahas11G0041500 [Arachis hypogaea]